MEKRDCDAQVLRGNILDEMMNMEKGKHNFMGSTCNHLRMLPIFSFFCVRNITVGSMI